MSVISPTWSLWSQKDIEYGKREDYYKLLFAVIIYPVVSMRTNFATS